MNTWNKLITISDNYQKSLLSEVKKQNGIYYTHPDLAYFIMKNMFSTTKLLEEKHIWSLSFLEPCGGLGSFVFAYLRIIKEQFKLTKTQAFNLIHNIYYCESDNLAAENYRSLLMLFAKEYFNINICSKDINIGGALIYDFSSQQPVKYKPISDYFQKNKFDIIVTNPPYKNLRAEKRKFSTINDFLNMKKKYAEIKNDAISRFSLSPKGGANLYKYFSEEIISRYSHSGSRITLLIPSTILTDKTCSSLREHIIHKDLISVGYIPESSHAVKAKQSLSYLTMINQKAISNRDIHVIIHKDQSYTHSYIKRKQLISTSHDNSIVITNDHNYDILNLLERSPKIKDLNFILNQRGELDISLNKNFITESPTSLRLIKGRNIHKYHMDDNSALYVKPEFLTYSKKAKYMQNFRIACQQIVNIDKKDRLIFSLIPPKHILGNSCNFLSISNNQFGIDLFFLLGILNSNIVNWYFKLFSSNSHVNNYQIDLLPLPIVSLKQVTELSSLVKEMVSNPSNELNKKINQKVVNYFKNSSNTTKKTLQGKKKKMNKLPKEKNLQLSLLTPFEDDISELAQSKKTEIKSAVDNHLLLNNTTYKLSKLDMQMVKSIPEGGNWQNIPDKIVQKSKRLQGITKSGGRTTLYGRLKYCNPSYTITTYFNRPGNGCYIHPIKDRVITTREAARLQSFPDSYYFFGNQRDKLNQIGNAVPPIIGFQLGRQLKDQLNVSNAVELFAGAGGMLYGMKKAGIKHIIANDINKSACVTLKINNPETNVLCGNITDELIQHEIISKAIKEKADIIVGGPPCQGFSLAGFRREDDPRNKLFKQFYKIVKEVHPKAFIFENVPGLLSYNAGKTYNEIKQVFKDLNYNVVGNQLMFSEYAVPQKRKRVIIIGVRNDLNVNPKSLYPIKTTSKHFISVSDAISNIESIEHNRMVKTPPSETLYQKFIQNEISIQQYIDTIINRNY